MTAGLPRMRPARLSRLGEDAALQRYGRMLDAQRGSVEFLRDAAAGETVFAIGCGPSLQRQDPALLRGRPVITTNSAHLWLPEAQRSEPLCGACIDSLRLLEMHASGHLGAVRSRLIVQPNRFSSTASGAVRPGPSRLGAGVNPADQLRSLLARHAVVLVYGGPGTGKSWLCERHAGDHALIQTDDWVPPTDERPAGKRWRPGITWDEAPWHIAGEARRHERCVVEGVRSLSVTRHGVKPGAVLIMTTPKRPLSPRQRSMALARIQTLAKWLRSPAAAGVEVVYEGQEC